jgi:hypothetical protein
MLWLHMSARQVCFGRASNPVVFGKIPNLGEASFAGFEVLHNHGKTSTQRWFRQNQDRDDD